MSDTIREHYIPQFYLKNFSQDKRRIYQYQIGTKKSSKLVPVESICCEKNLYEFKNDDGSFAYKNLIENCFSKLEGEISKIIKSIVSKSSHQKNFYTLCFLSSEEKAMLIYFVTTLFLRSPTILNVAQNTALEFCGEEISDRIAHNLALNYCVPIFKELNPNDRNLLNSAMKWFVDMAFQICITSKDKIITCDNPVLLRKQEENNELKPDVVMLPLTPQILLYMKTLDRAEFSKRNRLVYLDESAVKPYNDQIILNSQKWIFSMTEFTNEQIKHIEKIKGENNDGIF